MADNYSSGSRYRDTRITDFYLDIWNADALEQTATVDDREYIIESKYEGRPDLLAYEVYGDPSQWWKIAMRNKDKLVDPINDFTAGKTIWLPPARSR